MVVAKGNHDGGPLYGEVFDFIADGDKQVYYYNTTFGDLASVITLDTNISGTGAQEEFLKASLEKLRDQARKDGSRSLMDDGLLKASRGITSVNEVLRACALEEPES